MISDTSLRAIQLLIGYGNCVHCLPFEWCKERRGLRTLEHNQRKWRLCQVVIFLHILLRLVLVTSVFIGLAIDSFHVSEVILILFFLSVYILTVISLVEFLVRYNDVVVAFNSNLTLHYWTGE
jgi:hypothetical protein